MARPAQSLAWPFHETPENVSVNAGPEFGRVHLCQFGVRIEETVGCVDRGTLSIVCT